MSSNEMIIIEEAVKHGLISETEGELALIYHTDIGLHTPSYWADHYHKMPKKGETGIKTKLWKRIDNTNDKPRYRLVTSYLLTHNQVEDIEE